LGAIKDVLGEAASDDILAAWGEAYWLLADVLIAREGSIYRELAAAPGGRNGWRDFVVESTEPESEVNRSFVLVPADAGPVLDHRPGQYLTFALDLPGAGRVKRNYSISSAPNGRSYRPRSSANRARRAARDRLELVPRPGRSGHPAQRGAARRRVLPRPGGSGSAVSETSKKGTVAGCSGSRRGRPHRAGQLPLPGPDLARLPSGCRRRASCSKAN
jgi:hypothetical protein